MICLDLCITYYDIFQAIRHDFSINYGYSIEIPRVSHNLRFPIYTGAITSINDNLALVKQENLS